MKDPHLEKSENDIPARRTLDPNHVPLLQQVDFPDEEISTFNNYVYTIVEYTTKAVSPSPFSKDKPPNIYATSSRVFRSYADEKTAAEVCEGRNNVQDWYLSFNLPIPTSEADWLLKHFGSSCATSTVDPVTYEVLITVLKYEYVKNELHGSALEKEQVWH